MSKETVERWPRYSISIQPELACWLKGRSGGAQIAPTIIFLLNELKRREQEEIADVREIRRNLAEILTVVSGSRIISD